MGVLFSAFEFLYSMMFTVAGPPTAPAVTNLGISNKEGMSI